MSKSLTKGIRRPGLPAPTVVSDAPLKAIGYACSFWAEHLYSYLGDDSIDDLHCTRYLSDQGRVYKFLLQHLLHWLKALSHIGEVDRGIRGLHSLEKQLTNLRPNISVNYKNFVRDAIRVLRQFRPAVEEAPLQVYYSTLIFSPENSII